MAVHRHSQSPPKSQPQASKIHLKKGNSDKIKYTNTTATESKVSKPSISKSSIMHDPEPITSTLPAPHPFSLRLVIMSSSHHLLGLPSGCFSKVFTPKFCTHSILATC
jgi:hypothetical protein